MVLSLHAIIIPTAQQMLGTLAHLLGKAETHCADNGLPPEAIIQARIAPDMLPFAYQVKSALVHSVGAIEGVKAGLFSPDQTTPPDSFAGLNDRIAGAIEQLAAYDSEEIDALQGRDMRFSIGSKNIDFTAENFLLSFSQPNLYFHVTTAYNILRAQGVAIGKRDFLVQMRSKS